MHLLKELIIHILSKEVCRIDFNISEETLAAAIESTCFIALKEIKEIIHDKNLDDFTAVEKIVTLFEKIDIDPCSRHDL